MAHFNFEVTLTDATRMDAPIERGPLMRWQRKALESGFSRLSMSDKVSSSGPNSANPCTPTSRNPIQISRSGLTPRTPNTAAASVGRWTPNQKMGGRQQLKSDSNTPHKSMDRFIPNRSAMDLDLSHRMLNAENVDPVTSEMSPRSTEYRRHLKEAVGGCPAQSKILAFSQKAPAASESQVNNLKVLYSSGARNATKPVSARHIAQLPFKVLDAPQLIDDYYLNLLSWSSNNILTVALGGDVFLWNPISGDITQLVELEGEDNYVSSVSWIKEGNFLGVGVSDGSVQLWDVGRQKLLRTMCGHAARVGTLAWNSYILSSGSRTGVIHHHDVRVAEHHVGTLCHHTQEVCGLAWSPDSLHLVSGGNDNLVNIWDRNLSHESTTPVHSFTHHQAAVKAVAWCPWQPTLLATGGGTADRHIRFWNVTSGSCVGRTDTQSQVSALVWSEEHRELISGHGFVQNQLSIWKYPAMTRQANLTGHTERILSLAASPDGSFIASAAADETIRLWKLFEPTEKKRSAIATTTNDKLSMLSKGIR